MHIQYMERDGEWFADGILVICGFALGVWTIIVVAMLGLV